MAAQQPGTAGPVSVTSPARGAAVPPGPPRRPAPLTGAEIIAAIGADGISNAELASVANTLKGDIGAGLDDLTAAEVRTLIEVARGATPGLPHFGAYVTGQVHALTSMGAATALATSVLGAANRMVLYPFVPQRTFTPSQLGSYCTAGEASGELKNLVYTSNSSGWPDALLYSSAAISCAAAVTNTYLAESSGLPQFVAGSTYWLGVAASSNPTMRSITNSAAAINVSGHIATTAATAFSTAVRRAGITFATPPDPYTFVIGELLAATPIVLIAVI